MRSKVVDRSEHKMYVLDTTRIGFADATDPRPFVVLRVEGTSSVMRFGTEQEKTQFQDWMLKTYQFERANFYPGLSKDEMMLIKLTFGRGE